jgi:hypothetical protein
VYDPIEDHSNMRFPARIQLFLVLALLIVPPVLQAQRRRAVFPPSSLDPIRTDYAFEVIPEVTYAVMDGWDLKMEIVRPIGVPGRMPVVIFGQKLALYEDSRHDGVENGWTPGFARRGYFSVSVDVRHTALFPAVVHDLSAAVRFLRRNADRYGIDPDRIGLFGFNATGTAMAVLATGGDTIAPDSSGISNRVQAAIVVSAWSDASAIPASCSAMLENLSWLTGCFNCPEVLAASNPVAYATPDDPPFFVLGAGKIDNYAEACLAMSEKLSNELISHGVQSTYWKGPSCTTPGGAPICLPASGGMDRLYQFLDSALHVQRAQP